MVLVWWYFGLDRVDVGNRALPYVRNKEETCILNLRIYTCSRIRAQSVDAY